MILLLVSVSFAERKLFVFRLQTDELNITSIWKIQIKQSQRKTCKTISNDMNLKFKIGLQLFCLLMQRTRNGKKMFVVEKVFGRFLQHLHSK